MRINEITSAEEQIELWKLVSNSVWQSLQQQQEQQRRAQVASTSRAKRKPKTTVGMPIPKLPKVPTTRPPATVQQPTPTKQVGVQTQPSAIQPEGGQKTIGGSVYPSTGKMQMSPSQIKRRAGNTKEDERQNATNSDPLGVMGSNGRIKTSPISTVSR